MASQSKSRAEETQSQGPLMEVIRRPYQEGSNFTSILLTLSVSNAFSVKDDFEFADLQHLLAYGVSSKAILKTFCSSRGGTFPLLSIDVYL